MPKLRLTSQQLFQAMVNGDHVDIEDDGDVWSGVIVGLQAASGIRDLKYPIRTWNIELYDPKSDFINDLGYQTTE